MIKKRPYILTSSIVGGETYNLAYDAEGHLVTVTKGAETVASFTYDGDGKRVKAVEGSETILFVGAHFELNTTTSEVTKYYLAGATRVAVRKYTVPASSELTYLLGDHLGSTSLATDETGALLVETRYKAWGEVRYTTADSTLPTRYTYTGQYSYVSDDATDLGSPGFGLMYYGARWYDVALGRFVQADTIIPEQSQGTQAWDRYAGMNNNPITYTDPTGHFGIPSWLNPFSYPTLVVTGSGIGIKTLGVNVDVGIAVDTKTVKDVIKLMKSTTLTTIGTNTKEAINIINSPYAVLSKLGV